MPVIAWLRRPRTALIAALLAMSTACAAGVDDRPEASGAEVADWDEIRRAAEGQTVRWWMFGGDDGANRFVDDHVAPAAAELGVEVERVPVSDTADAVQRVIAEQRAGREEGRVDLIWVNGQNFVAGKEAGLWLEDWATALPRANLVDWTDPTIAEDFGEPVAGQESPFARATFVFAFDRERMDTPPGSFEELADHVRDHPGRVTYPAPPDFTGSAFVRQAVAALGEDEAFEWLAEITPWLWRDGETYPASEAELNQLFADGQVDLAMSYDPTFVATEVERGRFPTSTRPFALDSGSLQNTSYVTVPRNAASVEGALVVADLLLAPDLQAAMGDPSVWGMPTVLDADRLDDADAARFDDVSGPYVLDEAGELLEELPADRVDRLDERWREEILP